MTDVNPGSYTKSRWIRLHNSPTASTTGRWRSKDSAAYIARTAAVGTRRDGDRKTRAPRVSSRRSRSRVWHTDSHGGPVGGSDVANSSTSLVEVTDSSSKRPRTMKVVTWFPNWSMRSARVSGTGEMSMELLSTCWRTVLRGRMWISLWDSSAGSS